MPRMIEQASVDPHIHVDAQNPVHGPACVGEHPVVELHALVPNGDQPCRQCDCQPDKHDRQSATTRSIPSSGCRTLIGFAVPARSPMRMARTTVAPPPVTTITPRKTYEIGEQGRDWYAIRRPRRRCSITPTRPRPTPAPRSAWISPIRPMNTPTMATVSKRTSDMGRPAMSQSLSSDQTGKRAAARRALLASSRGRAAPAQGCHEQDDAADEQDRRPAANAQSATLAQA